MLLGELIDFQHTKRQYGVEKHLAHRIGIGLDPAWWDSLTDREKLAVEWYRDAGHEVINASLRGRQVDLADYQTDLDAMEAEYGYRMSAEEAIDLLDAAVKKSRFNKDIAVYRGVKRDDDAQVLREMRVGETFVDPAFVSTTVNPRYAYYAFGYRSRLVIRLLVRSGTSAAYVSHTDGTEAEVLLGRGKRFTLLTRRRVRPKGHKGYELLTFAVDD